MPLTMEDFTQHDIILISFMLFENYDKVKCSQWKVSQTVIYYICRDCVESDGCPEQEVQDPNYTYLHSHVSWIYPTVERLFMILNGGFVFLPHVCLCSVSVKSVCSVSVMFVSALLALSLSLLCLCYVCLCSVSVKFVSALLVLCLSLLCYC